MFSIIEQCLDMEKQTCVAPNGSIVPMKPTHLLLTQEHYEAILKTNGINAKNMPSPIKELFGLKVLVTDVPIEEPRVLSITE